MQAFIDAHDARIEREKQEQLEELRKRVLNRALIIVGHSNDHMQEYHCGDEVSTSNWQQNDTFMKELRLLIDHGKKCSAS